MGKIEKATKWMVDIANDRRHGYCQTHRWGTDGDYDCSGLNITGWEKAGVKVKSAGAITTRNIKEVYMECGFEDVTSEVNMKTGLGIQYGDVLLSIGHHVAQCCAVSGGKATKIVHASINEKGTTKGGKPGDQTGKEICVRSYYNYPWTCVLRYKETENVNTEVVSKGEYYSASNKSTLVEGLNAIHVDSSYANRKKIAKANGISNYSGTAQQNTKLLELLKSGKLIKVGFTSTKAESTSTKSVSYYPKATASTLVNALKIIKVDSSYANRKKIAKANGISNYSGTAQQNTKLLELLKSGKLIKA